MTYSRGQRGRGPAAVALLSAFIALPFGIAQAQTASPPAAATAPAPAPAAPAAAPSAPAPQTAAPQAARDPQVERRIAELHKRLRITQQQEAPFTAFADIMRTNAQAMDTMAEQQQQKQPNSTAVNDLKAYEQFTEAHAEGLKRLIPAFQSLYETLNDQQKKTADAVLGHAAERAQQRQAHPRG